MASRPAYPLLRMGHILYRLTKMDRKKKLAEFLKDLRQNNEINRADKRDLESMVKKLSNPKISEDTVDTILNSYKCLYNMNRYEQQKDKKPNSNKPEQEIDPYETQKFKAKSFGHGIIYSTCFTQGNREQEEILLTGIKKYEN